MELYLYHGRYSPNQEMPNWGFNGPELNGVTGIRCTYRHFEIWFDSLEATEKAKKLTGWSDGDNDNSLEITTRDSFIVCQLTNEKGAPRTAYFGDWILE